MEHEIDTKESSYQKRTACDSTQRELPQVEMNECSNCAQREHCHIEVSEQTRLAQQLLGSGGMVWSVILTFGLPLIGLFIGAVAGSDTPWKQVLYGTGGFIIGTILAKITIHLTLPRMRR